MIVPRRKVTITRTKRYILLSRVRRGLGVLDIEDLLLYLSPETMNLECEDASQPALLEASWGLSEV